MLMIQTIDNPGIAIVIFFVIGTFDIWICFGFRYSDFVFTVVILA